MFLLQMVNDGFFWAGVLIGGILVFVFRPLIDVSLKKLLRQND